MSPKSLGPLAQIWPRPRVFLGSIHYIQYSWPNNPKRLGLGVPNILGIFFRPICQVWTTWLILFCKFTRPSEHFTFRTKMVRTKIMPALSPIAILYYSTTAHTPPKSGVLRKLFWHYTTLNDGSIRKEPSFVVYTTRLWLPRDLLECLLRNYCG